MYDSQNISVALSRMVDEQINNKENRTGFYRAVVVDVNDPLHLARIKVRIPSFHGVDPSQSVYTPDSRLPYAFPATMNGAGYKMGQYILPVVGSLVWVSFETGTTNLVYFGGIYCADPTGNRYLYFDRNANNGQAVQIVEDDIPDDYNPNQYVIFRSPKGASIYIDDRDRGENVTIQDTHRNKILLNRNGVSITSDFPLKANFPYMITCYIDINNVLETPIFTVPGSMVFEDLEFKTQASPIKGCKIAYISDAFVDKSYQNQNIGKKLYNETIKFLEETYDGVITIVREDNIKSSKLLENNKFKKVGFNEIIYNFGFINAIKFYFTTFTWLAVGYDIYLKINDKKIIEKNSSLTQIIWFFILNLLLALPLWLTIHSNIENLNITILAYLTSAQPLELIKVVVALLFVLLFA